MFTLLYRRRTMGTQFAHMLSPWNCDIQAFGHFSCRTICIAPRKRGPG